MSAYTTIQWATLCAEWSKFRIELLEGALITLRHDNPSAETLRARERWAPRGHERSDEASEMEQALAAAREALVTPLGLEPKFSA
jgi:hypothetical protein